MNEIQESADSLRSLAEHIQRCLAQLEELSRVALHDHAEDAILAARQRVLAARRHVGRALVEVHKGKGAAFSPGKS